jgi:hypothetical protein
MIQKVEHKVLESIEKQSQGYRGLFKDKRLFKTFQGIVEGIVVSGSSRISRIASGSLDYSSIVFAATSSLAAGDG